jgi:hypothetical protein
LRILEESLFAEGDQTQPFPFFGGVVSEMLEEAGFGINVVLLTCRLCQK